MPTYRQPRRRRARTQVRRDSRRALAVCLLFGVAVTAGLGTVIQQVPSISSRMASDSSESGQGVEDFATGAIIIVPLMGNTCRKKVIDNATWLIRDEGPVECRAALPQGPMVTSGAGPRRASTSSATDSTAADRSQVGPRAAIR